MERVRTSHPSPAQLEALVQFLERKPSLAKGFSKSLGAKQLAHKEWSRLATTLNSMGGCIKDDKKWIKYWNDKKSFVKKKAAARARARRQTGGGNVDVPELTEVEERILTLMGGEGFAVGDTHLRIEPFESENQESESPSILARGLYEEPVPGTSGVLLEQPIDYTPDEIIIDNAERNNLNAIVDHGLESDNITLQNQEMPPETVPVTYNTDNTENADSVQVNVSERIPLRRRSRQPPSVTSSDHHLEFRLLTNGGSIEKSKSAIDRLCTLRTLNPQLFGVYNVKEDFAHVFDNGISYALPKVMEDDIRVFFVKFYEKDHIKTYFVDFLRYVVVMAEYMMYHDYLNKTVIVFDFLDINLNSFVTDMDFMEFKRHTTVLLEGFRVKPQKILLMTESKLASTLLTILKNLLKPKIIQRIQVIRNHEELRKIVPREILPKDYGGDEIAFKDLKEKWVNELSSPKMIQMLKQRSKERTDESLRPMSQFSEQYAGMEGTFRFLRVD